MCNYIQYLLILKEYTIQRTREQGIPTKLVRLTKRTTQSTNGRFSELCSTRIGLIRQGDPMTTVLFNIVLEKVIRQGKVNKSGYVTNKSHQIRKRIKRRIVSFVAGRNGIKYKWRKSKVRGNEKVNTKCRTERTSFIILSYFSIRNDVWGVPFKI